MSAKRNFEHLLEDLQEDAGLRAELQGVGHRVADLVHRALAHGYEICEKEAKELLESLHELSDDDLDKVAGGDDAWGSGSTTGGTGGTTTGGTGTP
jgi:hypothetical protein